MQQNPLTDGVTNWTPTNMDGSISALTSVLLQISPKMYFVSFFGTADRDGSGYSHINLPVTAQKSTFLAGYETTKIYVTEGYSAVTVQHVDNTSLFGFSGIIIV